MKKKLLVITLALLAAIVSAFALAGCGETEKPDDGEQNNNPPTHEHTFSTEWEHDETHHWHKATCEHADEIKDKAEHTFNSAHKCTVCDYVTEKPVGTELTVTDFDEIGDGYYLKVPYSTDKFSFIGKVTVSEGATWRVFTDIDCTKEVPSRTRALNPGDNRFYILVTSGNDVSCYSFLVRRRQIYTVSFETGGGSNVGSQQVEEDDYATEPTTARKGYDFKSWDYDFTQPITKNTVVTASWSVIRYKVTYELDGGKLLGNYPRTYTIESDITLSKPLKDYYDFTGWSNGGRITKGSTGDKTFTASYTPIVYNITYECGNGSSMENVTSYTVESPTIKLSDGFDMNADFVEWRKDGKKITEIPKGSHGNITLTAVWRTYDVLLEIAEGGGAYVVTGRGANAGSEVVIKPEYKSFPVTAIKAEAFRGLSDLIGITIPASVASVGENAFEGCPIETATMPACAISAIPKSNLTTVVINGGESIAPDAFSGCTSLTSITIGDTVTSIGNNAFSGCTGLTDITIPNSVTSIGSSAFNGCCKLTSITISNSVTAIGDYAFV